MDAIPTLDSRLSYTGPEEVLIRTPVTLSGTYHAQSIDRLTLKAEDKHPFQLTVDMNTGTWSVKLDEGFYNSGSRWLRLSGYDRAGGVVAEKVIPLRVSDTPLSIGKDVILTVREDTIFKDMPLDSANLADDFKTFVSAGTQFPLLRYGYADGHIQVELQEAFGVIGQFGYFFEKHVELKKGEEVLHFDLEEVPVPIPGTAKVLMTQDTWLKAEPIDSGLLAASKKQWLHRGQTLTILGYAAFRGHFQVTFLEPRSGFGSQGYLYWEHVAIEKDGKPIVFDPDALTLTLKKDTLFKKRAVNSNNLSDREKVQLRKGSVYGLLGYSPAEQHLRVALSENLRGFGNSGYFFIEDVEVRRGSKPVELSPAQVELNVPYFSQRDNAHRPASTCNVTAIAMVMYYYGVRPQGSKQLEDELYEWCVRRYGANSQTDNTVLVRMSQAYGFEASFSTTRTWGQIRSQLMQGRPVVVGGYFTHAGHIVCLVGYTPSGYIVNDPYGNALTGYRDTNGRKLFYSNAYMNQMCAPEGDGNIWAHFIAPKAPKRS